MDAAKEEKGLSAFLETDYEKQIELERELESQKLESILSPVYFIWNVNAVIIGG